MRTIKQWPGLFPGIMDTPSLEVFKQKLGSQSGRSEDTCPGQVVGLEDLQGHSNPMILSLQD